MTYHEKYHLVTRKQKFQVLLQWVSQIRYAHASLTEIIDRTVIIAVLANWTIYSFGIDEIRTSFFWKWWKKIYNIQLIRFPLHTMYPPKTKNKNMPCTIPIRDQETSRKASKPRLNFPENPIDPKTGNPTRHPPIPTRRHTSRRQR